MTDPVRTSNALKKLGISELTEEWVSNVWDQDFTESSSLPPSLEQNVADSRHYSSHMQSALDDCTPWARIDFTTLPKGFWSVLSDDEISPRALLALLHHFMASVDKLLSPATQKEAGIKAAHLYFTLIEIPGSGAYNIFHPLLFQAATDVLKLWPSADGGKRKRQQSGSNASQQSKSRRVDGSQRSQRRSSGDLFAEDEDDEEVVSLTTSEINRIQKAVLACLRGLVQMLRNFSLKDKEQSSHHALQVLSQLSRYPGAQQDRGMNLNSSVDLSVVESLQDLAFLGLHAMCCGSHGDRTLTMTFKYLMPSLLMFLGDNEAVAMSSIPKHAQTTKDNAIKFVNHVAVELGDHALLSVRTLLQHMCVKVPDKIEYRTHTANTVASILGKMPADFHARFMQWVYKFSRNIKTSYRVFAIELCTVLLELPERVANDSTTTECQQFLTHKFLLQLLLSRCSDKAPTVRARSLACFAQFSSSDNPAIKRAVIELCFPSHQTATPGSLLGNRLHFVYPTPPHLQSAVSAKYAENAGKSAENAGKSAEDAGKTAEDAGKTGDANQADGATAPGGEGAQQSGNASGKKDGATPGNLLGGSPALMMDISGSGATEGKGIFAMLKRRASCDEKVTVRKAALQALENVLRLNVAALSDDDVQVLHDRCLDPALSVRKQAMNSLTLLLTGNPESLVLQKAWLDGVLPVVNDREMTAQEKCLETLRDLLLNQIVPANRTSSSKHKLAWDLLHVMAAPESRELRSYLRKACQMWSRQKVITPNLVKALTTHLDTRHSQAAWMLLAEAAPSCNHFDPVIVVEAWRRYTSEGADTMPGTLLRILSVLGSVSSRIDEDFRVELIEDFRGRLLKFESTTEMISSMISALYKLCMCGGDEESAAGQKKMHEVAGEILKACDGYLSDIVLTECPSQLVICEVTFIAYLFTLGELAMLCPEKTPKRLYVVVQSLLAGPNAMEGGELPSTQASQFGSQTQVPLSQLSGGILTNTVRAHTFITLGKMCLQEEWLAKRCVAALARELETSKDPAIRNNVVVVMCDLCVRYPNVVDRYISNMAACLKDESTLVRRQTLTMLTHLLLEDYVKWRGILFFRFIVTLVDEDKDIQKFADFCFVEMLLHRHPTMLFQHFIECIFYFNSYDKHSVYNQISQTDREKQLFSLKGVANAEKRHKIYRFMLQHMTDEQRFNLAAKLSQEVLGAVVDNILPLNDDTNAILKDTLTILSCKEIKLSSLRSKPGHEDGDEMEMAETVMAQAKTKLISAVVKKNVIENIIPIIISLKYMLEKQHSPVLRELMLYLREVMKDYRNEVKDILSADRQLASEIEFDLRRFDEQQAEEARQKAEQQAALAAAKNPKPATPDRVAQLLSPRSVSNCSPKMLPSPRLRVAGSPRQPGTPPLPRTTKTVSLATQAIVNSVREKLQAIQVNTPDRASNKVQFQSPKVPSSKPQSPKVPSSKPQSPKVQENGDAGESESESMDVTGPSRTPRTENRPPRRHKKVPSPGGRAISTPDRTIANITFFGLTSPIPVWSGSEDSSKKVPGTPSWMPQMEEDDDDDDIIILPSPEHPRPKPSQWNITSPSTRDKGSVGRHRGRTKASSQPDPPIKMEFVEPSPKPQPSSSRRSRTRQSSAQSEENESSGRRSSRTRQSSAESEMNTSTGSKRSNSGTRQRRSQNAEKETSSRRSSRTRQSSAESEINTSNRSTRSNSGTRKSNSQSEDSKANTSTRSKRSSSRSRVPAKRQSGRVKSK